METNPVEQARRMRGLTAIEQLRKALSKYTFAGSNEAQVQAQLVAALHMHNAFSGEPPSDRRIEVLGSEVVTELGRFDVLVGILVGDVAHRVVIELKVRGTAEAAERQAQRYAKHDGVDAVVIATSSSRLAMNISIGAGEAFVHQSLGGKPFGVVYLRPF